jgi:S1-C subfamily serine protease
MNNILYTLALLICFSAFGQNKFKNNLIDYFDTSKSLDPIEGLWTLNSTLKVYNNKGDIIYNNFTEVVSEWGVVRYDKLSFKVMDIGEGQKKENNFEAFFESSAIKGFYTYKMLWKDYNVKVKANAELINNVGIKYGYWIPKQKLIEMNLDPKTHSAYWDFLWTKKYPFVSSSNLSPSNQNKWAGNGSGIIISKFGHIVTNYHVIDGANDIEVEFIVDGDVKKFNAEIVQSDKVNDLAIIEIVDMNFDGLDNLPYNFKTRSSDVGTKVYAYGYPMALSLMGKEIKITDGIISSKSGFDGNITTYQITAPIQAGNSGGPLFDDKGNFIGINSSGLSKDVADNVGYTIKSSYVLNLIDVLPKSIDLPSSTKLQSLPLTEQIKEISKYVVLVKVK